MTATPIRDLGLMDKNAGCACCSPAGDAEPRWVEQAENPTIMTDYLVEGMTCSHCVRSVTEELAVIPGVAGVDVDLRAGGVSRVRVASAAPLDDAAVRKAVETAGYALVPTP